MELDAISGAATVALTSTILFLLVAKAWTTVSRTIDSTPRFSGQIMHEAAQRFRDELDRLTCSQSTYLSGALVFVMLFVAAYLLQAKLLFAGYPSWQLYMQLIFLLLATGYAGFRLVKTGRARYQVKFLRDANVAIGHQLRLVTLTGARVFHDVPTTAGVVDHVIIGQKGLYAVNVIAHRASKRAQVKLIDNALEFSDSDCLHSIVDINAKTIRLQTEFRKLLGHNVRVRSVIAIPGWEIAAQSSDAHLLVNERTIAMLSGWNDNSDQQMTEDVDALQQDLVSRCARR